MSRLDFGSIYKEEKFDYIHSHTKYFELSLEKRKIEIKDILNSIKSNFIAEIQKDIIRFQSMEDSLAKDFLKKNKGETFPEFPTGDREGLLTYIKALKNITDNQEGTAAMSLIKLKDNSKFLIQESNAVIEATEKVFKDFTKQVPKTTRTRIGKKGKPIVTTFIDDDELEKALKEDKELQKKYNEIVKPLKQKIARNLKENRKNLENYLKILIEYTAGLYDPLRQVMVHDDKTLETASGDFLKSLEAMGVDTTLTGKALEKNITQAITKMGPEAFFSTFLDESKAKAYLGGQIEIFNTNSQLGTLNEVAKIDAFAQLHANNVAHSIPYLIGVNNINDTGTDTFINTRSTMDMTLAQKSKGSSGQIIFGASLKLVAKDSDISTSIQEELWIEQLKNFIGQKNIKNYSYLRKNVIALNSFSRDKGKVKLDAIDFLDFEKELLLIIGAIRLTIGIYEKANRQVQSAGAAVKGKDGKLFYTAYLFTATNVFSMSDILQAIINEFKSKGKDQNIISFEGKPKENPSKLNKKDLQDLWSKKQTAILNFRTNENKNWFRGLTYKGIMSNADIAKEMIKINKFLGDFSYKGTIKVRTTENILDQYIK